MVIVVVGTPPPPFDPPSPAAPPVATRPPEPTAPPVALVPPDPGVPPAAALPPTPWLPPVPGVPLSFGPLCPPVGLQAAARVPRARTGTSRRRRSRCMCGAPSEGLAGDVPSTRPGCPPLRPQP